MHPWILGAGLWALAAAAPAAGTACPGPRTAVQEHYLSADCADCWQAGGGPGAAGWRFDWIVPGGADAPLAAAALPDAADRLRRLGMAAPAGAQPLTRSQPAAPPLPGMQLQVTSGPAWQGYLGVQGRVSVGRASRLPVGSQLWLALVELLPAGSEGSAQPRALLRGVAGPLSLEALTPGRPLAHLRALRWPEGARPERLQARGWLESPDGRLLAVAADRCATP